MHAAVKEINERETALGLLTSYVVQLLLGGHLDVPEVPLDLDESGVEASQRIGRRAPLGQLTRLLKVQ